MTPCKYLLGMFIEILFCHFGLTLCLLCCFPWLSQCKKVPSGIAPKKRQFQADVRGTHGKLTFHALVSMLAMKTSLKGFYSSNQTGKGHVPHPALKTNLHFFWLLINSATELIDKSFQINSSSDKGCILLITANRKEAKQDQDMMMSYLLISSSERQ